MAKATKEQLAVIKNFDIKRIVEGRGHDCGGLICDLYFKKKKVAEYHDDGWGGEPEIHYIDRADEKKIHDFLTANNYGELLFNNGYQFMDSADKVSVHSQLEDVIYQLQCIKGDEKTLKAIQRACKNKIVFGTVMRYSYFSWKGVKKLEDILKFKSGLTALQKAYDDAKARDGEVFNDTAELEKLGVKL